MGKGCHELLLICNHSRLPLLVLKDNIIRSVLIATLGDFCFTEYSKLFFFRTHELDRTHFFKNGELVVFIVLAVDTPTGLQVDYQI